MLKTNKIPRKVYAVTSFLQSGNEVLILLRSERVSTYRGKWGGISGVIDNSRTADEQALQEIEEETGLAKQDVELIRKGEPLVFDDEALPITKVVYPYLFGIRDRSKVRFDWEHRDMRWIKPADMAKYDTMPKLKETLDLVLPLQTDTP